MRTRPELSLEDSKLIKLDTKPTPSSSHSVVPVSFMDKDGTMKHGYKKLCDDNYPPLLAKYVVAFSILVRAALGERASEDRLVYNDAGKIIGTVSIEVPNFVPLLTAALFTPAKNYEDPNKEKMGNPDKDTLIKVNIAELLISAYIHKNDDLHPCNISINGLIDWDQLYWGEITSIIKGSRYVDGILCTAPSVKAEDLCKGKFPEIDGRVHWPTNFIPKNGNLWKMYKTRAFLELKNDSKFINQYFTAILKELLAFDKTMLTHRMKRCLGDETLNLQELPPNKRAALLKKEPKLFLNDAGKERGFIEHVMLFLEQEHIKFKNIVLGMPEFKEFLMELNNNAEKIIEIKKWFMKQNENNKYNTKYVDYNLNYIAIELHALWRECFKQEFSEHMKQLDGDITQQTKLFLMSNDFSDDINQLIDNYKTDLSSQKRPQHKKYEMTCEQLDEMIATTFNRPDNMDESKVSFICNHEMKPEESFTLNIALFLKIKAQATQLLEKTSQLIHKYQDKTDATIQDNHAFVENMKAIIKKNTDERIKLDSWLKKYIAKSIEKKEIEIFLKPHIYHMGALFSYIEKFNEKINVMLTHFNMNDAIVTQTPVMDEPNITLSDNSNTEPLTPVNDNAKNVPSFPQEKSLNPEDHHYVHTTMTIVPYLSTYLKEWVTPERTTLIKNYVNEVFTTYSKSQGKIKSALYFMPGIKPPRGREVCNLPLSEIFQDGGGGWECNSLNTLIIKKLCLIVLFELEKNLEPEKNKDLDYIISMHEFIKSMNDAWWGTVAKDIAEKSTLKIDHNQTILKAGVH